MNARSLPMLNAIGCLVLAAVVFLHWSKETRTAEAMAKLRVELATARDRADTEAKRAGNLERDIAVLKQALESTQRAAIEATDSLLEKETTTEGIRRELEAARLQVGDWKTSLAERDAKLRNLDAELANTRRRLDEAISRLKQAGAR